MRHELGPKAEKHLERFFRLAESFWKVLDGLCNEEGFIRLDMIKTEKLLEELNRNVVELTQAIREENTKGV